MYSVYAERDKNEREKYGKYYDTHISYYPNLPEKDKYKWLALLQLVDLAQEYYDLRPESEYAKNELQTAKSNLRDFCTAHDIEIE